MSSIPKDLRYTEDHEYVRASDVGDVVQIGITDYAQGELGDVVFLELPKPGAAFGKRAVFGTIEAVKAVSELYCPVAGTVIAANKALEQDPALVNRDPYGEGWMIKLKVNAPADLGGLLGAAAYAKHIGE
ncbi:MAG: glycine cleavage system protein GcvH [Gemmatimonadales bacterium]